MKSEVPEWAWILIVVCGLLAILMFVDGLGMVWPESVAWFFEVK
jgi:uncharacterized iron-regulated membrane protein